MRFCIRHFGINYLLIYSITVDRRITHPLTVVIHQQEIKQLNSCMHTVFLYFKECNPIFTICSSLWLMPIFRTVTHMLFERLLYCTKFGSECSVLFTCITMPLYTYAHN